MTETSPYEKGLTGFRALAAGWVVVFHLFGLVGPKVIAVSVFGYSVELHPLLTIGWVGAYLFFVLSGFLLTTRLMDRLAASEPRAAVKGYLVARIRRVFPAYWFQIFLLLVVALIAGGGWPAWAHWVPLHLVMLQNVVKEAGWAINPVFWTLPIEFAFYLCLPWIAAVLLKAEGGERRWRTLVFLVVGIVAFSWAYRLAVYQAFEARMREGWVTWAVNQIPGTIDQFMIGGAAAVALRWSAQARAKWSARRTELAGTVLGVVGGAGLIGMIYFVDHIFDIFWLGHWALYTWGTITAAFIALLLAGIAIGCRALRLVFSNPVAVFLGTISYSVYLWHYPIAFLAARYVNPAELGMWAFVGVTLPPIVIASALSYYLLERPFIRRAGVPTGREAPSVAFGGKAVAR